MVKPAYIAFVRSKVVGVYNPRRHGHLSGVFIAKYTRDKSMNAIDTSLYVFLGEATYLQ